MDVRVAITLKILKLIGGKPVAAIPDESYAAMAALYARFKQIHDALERRPCERGRHTATTLLQVHFSGAEAKRLIGLAEKAFDSTKPE